jgi:hypothetical protein
MMQHARNAPINAAQRAGDGNNGQRQNRGRGRNDRNHLTVRQVIQSNPLVARYITFARTILRMAVQSESDGIPPDYSSVCKAFYIGETISSRSGQALPSKRRAEKETVPPTERKRKSVDGKLAQKVEQLTPSILVPSSFGVGNQNKAFDSKSNSVRSKLRQEEVSYLMDNCPKKLTPIILRIAETRNQDKKVITGNAFNEAWNKWRGEHPNITDLAGAASKAFDIKDTNYFINRWTTTSYKQFLVLKEQGCTLTLPHARAALKFWDWISSLEEYSTDARFVTANQNLVSAEPDLDLQELKRMQGSTYWKKTGSLGRINPRVMLLTLLDAYPTEELTQRALEIFERPYFSTLLVEREGPDVVS